MPPIWPILVVLAAMDAPQAGPRANDAGTAYDFALPDSRGVVHRLSDLHGKKLVVAAFLGVECPLARRYGQRLGNIARDYEPRGVAFVGVMSNSQDSATDIAAYAKEHGIDFPLLKDDRHVAADRFGAERTPEVFVLDEERRIRYRGRIDDQYAVGIGRAQPQRYDLIAALDELLAGKAVTQPRTQAPGCLIGRGPAKAAQGKVTYTRDVALILQNRCQTCHRPGQIGPFSLTSYDDAAGWAGTIREVIEQGRMPPWHADPRYGRFANDPSLTDDEKKRIFQWIDGGLVEGDPADLPPPAKFNEGWNIPGPDVVLTIPRTFTVPAQGVLEYQYFEVDPGFTKDTWVRAAEIRPSNRAVVHHATVFIRPPGYDHLVAHGTLEAYCFAATTFGTAPFILPEGMAKVVPAGWRFVFVIHYQAVGSVQSDQTSIGLDLVDAATVKQEVATKLLEDQELVIPPHAGNHRVEKSWKAEHDVLLLAMFPHMHLRGKSFRYEAFYPDGRREILLDVPRYDFNWQHRYVLAEPKRLRAGTTLTCTAHYDNSAANPANPDPSATVRFGLQSWEEMFNGYFDVALAEQDLTERGVSWTPAIVALAVVLGLGFLWRRRMFRTRHGHRRRQAGGPCAVGPRRS
ncbi:MAG: redoxin domain-containing protein [Planctomycetia bacterium]|nr:redoxin domain-containing protein [Planctomycetia bacterium]